MGNKISPMQKIENVKLELRLHLKIKYGTQRKAAVKLGWEQSSISNFLSGRREICNDLLWDAGIVRYKGEYYWWPK